jgi:hypothetical protein
MWLHPLHSASHCPNVALILYFEPERLGWPQVPRSQGVGQTQLTPEPGQMSTKASHETSG